MQTSAHNVLSPEAYDYEREVLAEIGHHEPFFFGFRRVLMWGQLA